MSKYRKSFEIPFYDSDKWGRVTPLSILSYLGETSGEHTDRIGYGYKQLIESNYAWMLNRWKVKIDRYPKVKDRISNETWTSRVDRFYANREFLMYDSEGNEFGRASTLWIFIDMKRKRPIRIPEDFIEVARPIDEKLFNDFYEFEKDYTMDNYIDFHIRRSDIDYNNHVNNTKYLLWMMEAISQNTYDNYILNEFEILYKKEIAYGNTILSGVNEIESSCNKPEFIHSITSEDRSLNHALGWTKWKKI